MRKSPLAFAPFLFFHCLFFHLIALVEADQSLDFMPSGDAIVLAETGVFALLPQLRQGLFGVVKADEQVKQSIDASFIAHIGQLLRARGWPVVAVAETADIDQRNLCELGRL